MSQACVTFFGKISFRYQNYFGFRFDFRFGFNHSRKFENFLIILKFQASNSDHPQENVFYIKWFHLSWLGLHWRYQSRPRILFQCLTIDGNIENIIDKCLILFGISSSCPEFRIYNILFRCRFYFYRRYKNFETFLHGSLFQISNHLLFKMMQVTDNATAKCDKTVTSCLFEDSSWQRFNLFQQWSLFLLEKRQWQQIVCCKL